MGGQKFWDYINSDAFDMSNMAEIEVDNIQASGDLNGDEIMRMLMESAPITDDDLSEIFEQQINDLINSMAHGVAHTWVDDEDRDWMNILSQRVYDFLDRNPTLSNDTPFIVTLLLSIAYHNGKNNPYSSF